MALEHRIWEISRMANHLIAWPADQSTQYRTRHTAGMDAILDLYRDQIVPRFRTHRAPMPIVVLRAEGEPGPEFGSQYLANDCRPGVAEIVEVLYTVYSAGNLLCMQIPPGYRYAEINSKYGINGASQSPALMSAGNGTAATPAPTPVDPADYVCAIEMVCELSIPDNWTNARNSQYKPYSFPRSRLLAAIEEKAGTKKLFHGIEKPADRPDPNDVVRELGRPRFAGVNAHESTGRPMRAALSALFSPATTLGALVVGATSAKVINPAPTWMLFVIFAVAAVILAAIQFVQRNLIPLSWLGAANQWFTTTTFIGPVGNIPAEGFAPRRGRWWPRRSWRVRKERTRFVEQLITAMSGPGAGATTQDEALRYYLQLRVLALLEDLRANHSRWAPDLRRRKRTWPPMLFLPAADSTPGGIALLQAVSDVRSRRSEQDPLLILAHSQELHRRARTPQRTEAPSRYEAWLTAVRIDQSPSLGNHWPWVMDYSLTRHELTAPGADKEQPTARRSVWNLWSRWTLAGMVILLIGVGLWGNHMMSATYCGGSLFNYDPDLVWITGTQGNPSQCIGIDTTGAKEFVPPDGGVSLANTIPSVGPAADSGQPNTKLAEITLATIQGDIASENRNAEQSGRYVTFVYAGPLTTDSSRDEPQALGAIKELTGVYAWQYHVNSSNNPLKIRIDVANGGLDLADQHTMAEKIVAAADQDPTIVGVIGLPRDTSSTPDVVKMLGEKDLVVVTTTNSDYKLPYSWNYFGLAATNSEEAWALQLYTAGAANQYAAVIERKPDKPDPYSGQQATQAAAMLTRNHHFTLIGGQPLLFPVQGNASNIEQSRAGDEICAHKPGPSVVYLAGRSDDLPGLMTFIQDKARRCFPPNVIVLSGDDLTKNEYNDSANASLPLNTTLYYAALTNTAVTGPSSSLRQDLQNALKLSTAPVYGDHVYTDGVLGLAYDAAHALYEAAVNSPHRPGIAWALHCQVTLSDGATGPIGFANVRHGLQVWEVKPGQNGTPSLTPRPYSPSSDGQCVPPAR